MPELLARALKHNYAIGYFESWDQYSLEAALEAAEENESPAIIGFGGAVTDQAWLNHTGIEELSLLAAHLAEHSRVPTAVLFNEAHTIDQLVRAQRTGCNTLMLDTSHLPFDENIRLTKEVVTMAHSVGASVEAELGRLPDATNIASHSSGTDPSEAAKFVAETGLDALAVSIGNVHILSEGVAVIDLALLASIHSAVSVPLVIHGGTGFPSNAVKAAIDNGVAKFNVGTRLKQAYLAGIREAIGSLGTHHSIHRVIGSREPEDIFMHGKARVKAEIAQYMRLYGSVGQARNW